MTAAEALVRRRASPEDSSMGLGWKTAFVAALAVVLIALTLVARRRNFERFRAIHTRRKHRVPMQGASGPDQVGAERDARREDAC